MGALAPDGGPGAGGAPEGSGASGGGPRSPAGEQLDFYLREEPHLFAEAVREQMHRLEESARDDAARKLEAAEKAAEKGSAGDDMVLYERMGEVRALERSNNLQDIMYYSVVAKFLQLGVGLIEPLDGVVDLDGNGNLKELTEDVHSVEALEMVRNHLMQVLTGPSGGTAQSLNNMMKISKLQSAQVYAASIMFGYFLRRVDKRFQLDRAMGSLPDDPEDMARRLEEIFNSASADASWDEEEPPPDFVSDGFQEPSGPDAEAAALAKKRKSKMQEYVESFDQETLVETARIVSAEAAMLVERQTSTLFGDVQQLQQEMQAAVGQDASSVEELMDRMQQVVEQEKVKTLTLTISAQRRVVLEAVAYGAFLRDVESFVAIESVGLLTTNDETKNIY